MKNSNRSVKAIHLAVLLLVVVLSAALVSPTLARYSTTISAGTVTISATASHGSSAAFAYTGAVETFTANASGYYRLEVWGASDPASDLKGGYSTGALWLSKGQTVYVLVGGEAAAQDAEGLAQMSDTESYSGSATYIAAENTLLSDLGMQTDALLIGAGMETPEALDAESSDAVSEYLSAALLNTAVYAANETMPDLNGGTVTGRTGSGYAKITWLGKTTADANSYCAYVEPAAAPLDAE